MTPKYRVLHTLKGLSVGGVQAWIMNVLRQMDCDRIQFDFMVETRVEDGYEQEVLAAGGHIFRAPNFRHHGRCAARLTQILRRHGRYDALHVHGRHNASIPITVARGCRVPVRIVHVHNRNEYHDRTVIQRTYKRAAKSLLLRNASWIVGCSSACLDSLYGTGAARANTKLRVLPYGIDLARFTRWDTRTAVAEEFAIPAGHKVLGHVGRFVAPKRHAFIVDVFAELVRRDESWFLLFVGDGAIRADIEWRVARLGLDNRVAFAGSRDDVPELMSAMDVFILPTTVEGFGLVLIEAQALGLPCVFTDTTPAEADIVPGLFRRLSLRDPVSRWADAVSDIAGAGKRPPTQAHALVADSLFNIARSTRVLLEQYYGLAA
ncbi:MAG: glycosyltransferase [Proteobacteria bacterium]|nr:glycosyltransferase [Pseudomonadota bacterium]